ncbi:hypothetical protein GXW77_15780 [Roseomonas alkaliterrae]|uniref:Methyltransferase FkbM domain-containing protein n=1 Tax=Neoroseomonas alkaliterrae TaxID=1452450 RepID=A0A840XLU2_9PROT|nr:hypothetical protein [Neoroseomonas alkaliterrae]MBB5688886.1 hypothetical protein [Neoroseomonas alkaliterrae]MBR0677636.1 hypothetical protein [Neoroseomonas alkaliterrae]
MNNPVARIKGILGELLLNGRQALEVMRAQAMRLDRIDEGQALRLGRLEREQARRFAALERKLEAMGAHGGLPGVPGAPVEAIAAEPLDEIASLSRERARILRLAALLAPFRPRDARKVRVGPPRDGGYVMVEDWGGLAGAISIGIGDDDAWDRAMLGHGCPVAQFDHTITAPPGTAPGLAWQPLGIGTVDVNNIRTLRSLIALSGLPEAGDLVLKMDVEAAEWPVLAAGEATAPLERFRQILIEFHWFDRIGGDRWFAEAEAALTHLTRSHAVVHVHANNWGGAALIGGVPFPCVLEVTLLRRDVAELEPETGFFPTPLDAPCNPSRPDIFLGTFRFPQPPADE